MKRGQGFLATRKVDDWASPQQDIWEHQTINMHARECASEEVPTTRQQI